MGSGTGGSCNPALANLVFSGNQATKGGGIFDAGSSGGTSNPTLSNIIFRSNAATDSGGALYNDGSSSGVSTPTLTNVTLQGNSATNGGAIYNNSASPNLSNAILWGNTGTGSGSQIKDQVGTSSVIYSIVQGGWTGAGNISADPLFADAAGGDLRLLPDSPAIDSGTNTGAPTTDIRGASRPVNVVTDMGAYESRGFTLTKTSGDSQSSAINMAFGSALRVGIASAATPAEPVNGGTVTFTAPASSASATLSSSLATISSESASITATANATAGSYSVTASAAGVASANQVSFGLTNTKATASASLSNLSYTVSFR